MGRHVFSLYRFASGARSMRRRIRRGFGQKRTLAKTVSTARRMRRSHNVEAFREVDIILEEGFSHTMIGDQVIHYNTSKTGQPLTKSVSETTLSMIS